MKAVLRPVAVGLALLLGGCTSLLGARDVPTPEDSGADGAGDDSESGAGSGSGSGGNDGSSIDAGSESADSTLADGPADGGSSDVSSSESSSGSADGGGASPDSSMDGGREGGPEAGTDATVPCSPLDLSGVANVGVTTISGAVPSGSGGTIVGGTYDWTSETLYTGGTASNNVRGALVVDTAAQTFAFSFQSGDGGSPRGTVDSYSTSGSTLMLTLTCGGSGNTTVPFTATSFTLMLYWPSLERLDTYTRQ